jgi:hypothetical protein
MNIRIEEVITLPTIACRTMLQASVIVCIAAGATACAPAQMTGQPSDVNQTPEQRRVVEQERSSRDTENLKQLEAQVRAERRGDVWADRKEASIRASYTANIGARNGALRSIECRTSRCELSFMGSTSRSPGAMVAQQSAAASWLAANEPCGFTLAPESFTAQGFSTMRVFIDCARSP